MVEEIEKDAQKLFKKYSFLQLKTASIGMKNLSEYEKEVLDKAIELHRASLRDKLNKSHGIR